HASVFGAVLASIRSLDTRLVVFDTAVADLTDQLDDPVDVLFGTRLGGGTDINRALAYCQSRIARPAETVVVLISDLYEGGIRDEMLKRVAAMKASGVQFVALLALSDEGAPAYDREHAAALAALGAPAFACTPDLFPEVMAAASEKRPLPIPDPAGTPDQGRPPACRLRPPDVFARPTPAGPATAARHPVAACLPRPLRRPPTPSPPPPLTARCPPPALHRRPPARRPRPSGGLRVG